MSAVGPVLRRAWSAATRTWPRRTASAGLVVVLVAVAVAVATGGGEDRVVRTEGPTTSAPPTGDPAPASTSSTAPPTTLPPEPEGLRFLPEDVPDDGSRAPLTGLPVPDPGILGRPAVAVKVDNLDLPHETARPQTGLAHADVVVEEVVEGGITRFVAVLHSTDGPEVGPVRSARTTDVDLLPLFGRPLFAYSGGNPGVLAAVRSAGTFEDRGGEWAPAYARVRGRRAPHNLYVRPWEVLARPGGGSAPPVLAPFRPQAEPSPVGDPVQGIHLGFRGAAAAPASWTWLPGERRWLRHQRGSVHVDGTGYAVGPRNVVVVFTDHVESAADTRSPEAVTVGGGEAWVLTDGRLVRGRWERPDVHSPLVLLDEAGQRVSLAAGRTWIELVRPGTATVVP